MNCAAARAVLLEADLADLRGATDSELAAHLRSCEACRWAADAILATERAAGAWLARRAPRRRAGDARARRRATPRWAWRWAVPVAAAAGIVALVVTRPGDRPPSVPVPAATVEAPGHAGIAVRAPAGRSVAVFATADPDIVVIWLY
jgi:hypothetical protein